MCLHVGSELCVQLKGVSLVFERRELLVLRDSLSVVWVSTLGVTCAERLFECVV